MHRLLIPVLALASSLLAACASTPNQPTETLHTSKSPEAYTDCVMPKLQGPTQVPTLTQSQRHYKIVVASALTADNILEAYKAPTGGKIFLYERGLLANSFKHAAQECL